MEKIEIIIVLFFLFPITNEIKKVLIRLYGNIL